MNKQIVSNIIKESIDEYQRNQIDIYMKEFDGFNLKTAKQQLLELSRRLGLLKRSANSELFGSKFNKTSEYLGLVKKISELDKKIKTFDARKELIDSYVKKHSTYMFKKYGKII